MSGPRHGPGATRACIDALLAKNPKPSTLAARALVLSRLIGDIEHFVHWPALADSLRADLAVLLWRLGEGRKCS